MSYAINRLPLPIKGIEALLTAIVVKTQGKMIGHHDIATYRMAFCFKHGKELLHAGIAIAKLNEMQSSVTGKSDKSKCFFPDVGVMNNHALKIQRSSQRVPASALSQQHGRLVSIFIGYTVGLLPSLIEHSKNILTLWFVTHFVAEGKSKVH